MFSKFIDAFMEVANLDVYLLKFILENYKFTQYKYMFRMFKIHLFNSIFWKILNAFIR